MGGRQICGGTPGTAGPALECIACGQPLTFQPDSSPLVFRCENRHQLTLTDVLSEFPAQAGTPVTSVLQRWEEHVRLLQDLAGQALRNGHPFHAADLQEAAHRHDQWLSHLQALLAKEGATL